MSLKPTRGTAVFVKREPPDALAFLFHLRMHIEVEGQADRSMPQQGADRLAVRAVLDAARSEGTPQAVEPKPRQIVAFQKAFIKSAVGLRLQTPPAAREHVGFGIAAAQFAQQRHEKTGQRHIPHCAAGFGRREDHAAFRSSVPFFVKNTLHGFAHTYIAAFQIDVLPPRRAPLFDTQPADQDSCALASPFAEHRMHQALLLWRC